MMYAVNRGTPPCTTGCLIPAATPPMLVRRRAACLGFLCLVLILQQAAAAPDLRDSTTLDFVNKKVFCSFRLTVLSSIPPDSLQSLIFDYSSLREFSREVSVIRLLETSKDSYIVEFTIRYLFNEMVSTFRRSKSADGRILIEMLSTRQSLSLLPYVTATKAWFSFHPAGDVTRIEFYQEISLNQPIQWIHYEVIKNKLRGFARDFERFVRKREARQFGDSR